MLSSQGRDRIVTTLAGSGRREALPPLAPLRTVHEGFPFIRLKPLRRHLTGDTRNNLTLDISGRFRRSLATTCLEVVPPLWVERIGVQPCLGVTHNRSARHTEQDILLAGVGVMKDPVPVTLAGEVSSFDPPHSLVGMAAFDPAPETGPHVVIYFGEGALAHGVAIVVRPAA